MEEHWANRQWEHSPWVSCWQETRLMGVERTAAVIFAPFRPPLMSMNEKQAYHNLNCVWRINVSMAASTPVCPSNKALCSKSKWLFEWLTGQFIVWLGNIGCYGSEVVASFTASWEAQPRSKCRGEANIDKAKNTSQSALNSRKQETPSLFMVDNSCQPSYRQTEWCVLNLVPWLCESLACQKDKRWGPRSQQYIMTSKNPIKNW